MLSPTSHAPTRSSDEQGLSGKATPALEMKSGSASALSNNGRDMSQAKSSVVQQSTPNDGDDARRAQQTRNRVVWEELDVIAAAAGGRMTAASRRVCFLASWSLVRPDGGRFNVTKNFPPELCTHVVYGFVNLFAQDGEVSSIAFSHGWAIYFFLWFFGKPSYQSDHVMLRVVDRKKKNIS